MTNGLCNNNCSNAGECRFDGTQMKWYCHCWNVHYESDCSDAALSIIDPYRWLLTAAFVIASIIAITRIVAIWSQPWTVYGGTGGGGGGGAANKWSSIASSMSWSWWRSDHGLRVQCLIFAAACMIAGAGLAASVGYPF
jgi:hypothetical protein